MLVTTETTGTTTASIGWSCRPDGGTVLWSAWGPGGIIHGDAESLDAAKAQATAASEVLEGSNA